MKPLFILLIAFGITLGITKFATGTFDYALSGRVAMSVMLLFTAFGHFAFAKGMAKMIPGFIPFKLEMVYFTGVIEVLASAGLLISALRQITAWMLIIFFIVVLPANINATIKNIDYQKATNTGKGVEYLWFRVPLQIVFIAWVYFFGIYMD